MSTGLSFNQGFCWGLMVGLARTTKSLVDAARLETGAIVARWASVLLLISR